MIDGNHAATFTGATQIKAGARHLVFRALRFENAAASTILISAPDVRVTESEFIGCGDAQRPQAECLLILSGAARTELDFNTFVGSLSMSIKLRTGADAEPSQPTDASIHHNVFRDIVRRSSNGQEPIQVAGPGGGGSNVALRTRIEHNLFFRADGDVEAISIKTPGLKVRWNAFRDMDAAPNLRGSPDNTLAENVLIRTRPIRLAGPNNLVAGNILLCPLGGIALYVSHGSPGYAVAADSVIRDNIVALQEGRLVRGADQPLETIAHGNEIAGNTFHLTSRPVIEIRPPEVRGGQLRQSHFRDRVGPESVLKRSGMARVVCAADRSSYRMPVLRRLAEELGWEIVFGRKVPGSARAATDASFLHGMDFRAWSAAGSARYLVPVGAIIERFRPDAIVAEGALGMSSTWELAARRLSGGPRLLFWSIGYHPERPHAAGSPGHRQWPYLLAYAGRMP